MPISIKTLLIAAFSALVLGVFLGACYDVIRILRVFTGIYNGNESRLFENVYGKFVKNYFKIKKNKPVGTIMIFVSDLLFMFFAAVSFIVFLYAFNYGIFRWFILFSTILGFMAYYFTLGKIVIFFSKEISNFLTFILNVVISLFVFPFRILYKLASRVFGKFFKRLYTRVKNAIDIRKKTMYTNKCIREIHSNIEFKV